MFVLAFAVLSFAFSFRMSPRIARLVVLGIPLRALLIFGTFITFPVVFGGECHCYSTFADDISLYSIVFLGGKFDYALVAFAEFG